MYQQLPLADGRKERERGDDRLRRHAPHHPLGTEPGSHSVSAGQSPIAWLTVIPGFTPAGRASGDSCHTRRASSGPTSATGSDASSGCRAVSQRSGNSGIQQHAAASLVRWGLRVINQADNGTRIYPEDRDHRKVVTEWITYWYIVTSHDQPQSPRAVRRHRRAPAATPRAGRTRQPHS